MISVITNKTHTKKNIKELSILVSSYGLSFMMREQGQKKFFEYTLEKAHPVKLSQKLKEIVDERPVLKENFDQINLLHHNNLNTLIPQQFFDPNNLKLILQQNVKLLQTDALSYNFLEAQQLFNVYVPFNEITKYFIPHSHIINNWHSGSYFLQQAEVIKTEQTSLPIFEIFVNLFPADFQIVVYRNNKLLAYNHFDYQTTEEFLYYFFFMFETLNIQEPKSQIIILGQDAQHEVINELRDFTNKLQILPAKNPSQINNFF